ncbi:MAG: glycosyltransferase, partial [Actinomycetota bacterium]|nr:glycosyltransferase [Actinomycetota bacterium]
MTSVSGITVNYNAREHLLECLRSLRAQGVRDLVVADNASVDGAESAVLAEDPEVTYLQTGRNLGYGGGLNRGVARTDPASEILLCINPDAWLEPGALEAMLAAFEARPELGIVGPRVEDPDGTLYPSVREFPRLVDAVGHAVLGMVWG